MIDFILVFVLEKSSLQGKTDGRTEELGVKNASKKLNLVQYGLYAQRVSMAFRSVVI